MADAESLNLSEYVYAAINEWHAANGGGFAVNAVFVMDCIGPEGEEMTRFFAVPDQSTYKTLGLIEYAQTYYRQCAKRDVADMVWGDALHDDFEDE